MHESEMLEVLDRYDQAWTDSDIGLMKSVFHPQGSYSDGLWSQSCMAEHIESYFSLVFKESRTENFVTLDLIYVDPFKLFKNYVALTQDENGNEVERIRGSEFFTFKSGLIFSVLDQYYPVEPSLVREYAHRNVGFTSFKKYANSGLREIEIGRLHSSLLSLIVHEKIFLNPRLSSQELAKRVGCSNNHLSQVVNSRFGMGFNSLFNSYRVEHACDLLKSLPVRTELVEHIATKSGFSSISGFYKVFKDLTAYTPIQYRKEFYFGS